MVLFSLNAVIFTPRLTGHTPSENVASHPLNVSASIRLPRNNFPWQMWDEPLVFVEHDLQEHAARARAAQTGILSTNHPLNPKVRVFNLFKVQEQNLKGDVFCSSCVPGPLNEAEGLCPAHLFWLVQWEELPSGGGLFKSASLLWENREEAQNGVFRDTFTETGAPNTTPFTLSLHRSVQQ